MAVVVHAVLPASVVRPRLVPADRVRRCPRRPLVWGALVIVHGGAPRGPRSVGRGACDARVAAAPCLSPLRGQHEAVRSLPAPRLVLGRPCLPSTLFPTRVASAPALGRAGMQGGRSDTPHRSARARRVAADLLHREPSHDRRDPGVALWVPPRPRPGALSATLCQDGDDPVPRRERRAAGPADTRAPRCNGTEQTPRIGHGRPGVSRLIHCIAAPRTRIHSALGDAALRALRAPTRGARRWTARARPGRCGRCRLRSARGRPGGHRCGGGGRGRSPLGSPPAPSTRSRRSSPVRGSRAWRTR